MKRVLKYIANKFGYKISSINEISSIKNEERNYIIDLRGFLHNDSPVIFDVGANEGQSVRKFRKAFPTAIIHSFEPSPKTFEELKQQSSEFENVHLWNFALGSSVGKMEFLENSQSVMSSFLPPSKYAWGGITKKTLVEVRTIDQFCTDENIEYIDILKSDTQGFDLNVFKGAESMIRSNKIGLIYFELIFSDMYKGLPSVGEVFDFLTNRGFVFVSFYNFSYQNNLASWTDALFVHKSCIRD